MLFLREKTAVWDGKRDMRIWKSGAKKEKAVFLRKALSAVCIFLGSFSICVQAAPASLTSPDAAVYEQTDEESSRVGNLVEGSTFEYIGDVTAADGSVWHQITLSDGVNGYIRGDKEMEIRTTEPETEEQGGQEAASEEGGNTPVENEAEDAGMEADEQNAQENEEGGEPEDENEDSDENNAAAAVGIVQNHQEKKYVLNSTAKVKEREGAVDAAVDAPDQKPAKAGTDKTLLMGMAVVFFGAAAVYICLTRMRMLNYRIKGGGTLDADKEKLHRKIEKKKRRKKGKRMLKK